ncbi:MAG: carbohydrate-binding domain-containing protein, partial [Synergistaceae bacterium]|nr:carbohydrate-binding domain-containing protein [Synergistaceae bacterium]
MNVKKFSNIVYVLILGMFVLSLSGCGGSSNNNNNSTTTASKLMVVRSAAFVSGDTYQIYKGNNVSVLEEAVKTKKLYVAPAASGAEINTLNLQFSGTASNDEPFVITKSDGQTVVVAYNPSGTGTDTTTTTVTRYGGGTQQQKYTGLTISSVSGSEFEFVPSVIDIDTSDVVDIVLSTNDTATVGGTTITAQDYVWHLKPDYAGEYWTYGQSGTTKYTKKSEVEKLVSITKGVYIARDIRYAPKTFTYSESNTATKSNGTAEGDSDTLYVAYYNSDAENIPDSTYKYIAVALPSGMGDAPGGDMGSMTGTPPDQNGQEMGTPPNQSSQGGTPPAMPGSNFNASASNFDSIVKTMVHSESDAYDNPVLHITEPGTYRLSGSWNGQIWVDTDDDVSTDKVALILNGVTVNCNVAPALVFKKVYECYDDSTYSESDVASGYETINEKLLDSNDVYAGAVVVIANGTTNTFTGTNVPRLNDVTVNTDDSYTSSDLGNYVKAQEKLYKLDGAFHSRRSMVIGLADGATSGTLNVNSDYEGLDSEMHLLINSGTINVTADDDGINVNEDNMSVFYLEGGTVTVKSSGGDGIDSNGYVVATGGKLYISAGSTAIGAAGESGIDADKYVEITDNAAYYWAQAGSTNWTLQNSYSGTSENAPQQTNQPTTNDQQTTTNQETTTQQQTTTQSNT